MREENNRMVERKQVILEMMKSPSYVPMKIKEIIMMLQNPTLRDRQELEIILGELITEGKVIRTKRGKFAVPQTYNLVDLNFPRIS